MPLSSGLSSSFALSCGLLVMAPNSAQVVSLSAFTVRSGSALPSLHQNSHPMSHGTYSASKFIRSRTMRVASITSLPTPSPGIHAILYLAIGRRLYRRAPRSQPRGKQSRDYVGKQRIGSGERTRLACCIRRLAECTLPIETTRAHDVATPADVKAAAYTVASSDRCAPDYAFARRRDATSFSAPPTTINSCAAGLSGGKGNDFPSTLRIDFA